MKAQRVDRWPWRVGSGALIAATGSGEVIEARQPAPVVWELLETPVDVDELVTALAEAFDTPVPTVRADVMAFLDQLRAVGLVEVQP